MQYLRRNQVRGIVLPVAAMALTLGACAGAMEKITEAVPRASDFSVTNFEWNPYSKASMSVPTTFKQAPLTSEDYVNADGSCAGAAAPEGSSDQPISTAVGLTTPECAAVRTLGAPEKVDVGANERGERQVKLLYSRGSYPGLYVFTAGRLTEIQRVAEPAPPSKPQRQPAKPRRPAT
jgi:hypothetical protein